MALAAAIFLRRRLQRRRVAVVGEGEAAATIPHEPEMIQRGFWSHAAAGEQREVLQRSVQGATASPAAKGLHVVFSLSSKRKADADEPV